MWVVNPIPTLFVWNLLFLVHTTILDFLDVLSSVILINAQFNQSNALLCNGNWFNLNLITLSLHKTRTVKNILFRIPHQLAFIFSSFWQSIKFSFSLFDNTFDKIAPIWWLISNQQLKLKIKRFFFLILFKHIFLQSSQNNTQDCRWQYYHTRFMFGYDFVIVKLFRIWQQNPNF